MLNKFIKLSQMPPLAPVGAGALAMPPPPAAPMGMEVPPGPMGTPPIGGAPTTQPMSSPPDRPEIFDPLDSLGKILYDADATEMIENNVADSVEEIALKIWEMYGGSVEGGNDPGKIGLRDEEKQPLQDKTLLLKDKEQRWKRLPMGKHISDITSLEEIKKVLNGLALGTIKNIAKEGAVPPPGGMGMPPLASSLSNIVRLASVLDGIGYAVDADLIDSFLFPPLN